MSLTKKAIRWILLLLTACTLAGCKSDFKPYEHMHLIMTASGYSDYENNQSYVDQHTTPSLQEYVSVLFDVPTGTSIEEKEVFYETAGNTTKLLGCYIESGEYSQTAYWAYFVYEDNMLVTCHIYPMQVSQPM